MHNPARATITRRIRRHFLDADLQTGFALLRAATESCDAANQTFRFQQIEEARRVLRHAHWLYHGMPSRDAGAFAARMADLKRATDAAGGAS